MPEPFPKSNSEPQVHRPGFPNPFGYWKRRREDRFRREREDLKGYLQLATPIALLAGRLYEDWRDAVSEPVQDGQKAANLSANYWWQITDRLRKFEEIRPPGPAHRYHRLFADALRNASEGAEVVKNGFRFNKFTEISRGIGFLDRYVELMAEAESELGRLLRKYRLIEEDGGDAGGVGGAALR